MAQYELTIDAAGKKHDNEQVRDINALFPYTGGTYKTISFASRKGGIWCNCGGASQSVTLSVYDQLISGETVIKTSDTVTCRCYGRGPDDNNYATTVFMFWTPQESNAAIAAWNNKTLKIKRFVTIASYTSSKHGSPVFRDGFYEDTITISGTDTPFTNYGPKIEMFDVFRTSNNITEQPSSTKVCAHARISMVDAAGFENSTIRVYYASGVEPTQDSQFVDVKAYFSTGNLGVTQLLILGNSFGNGSDYYFKMEFVTGDEAATPIVDVALRASVPIMISDTNNGVAIGQYSSATSATPKFECKWPAYFYGGIKQIGSGSGSLMDLLGIQSGVTYARRVTSGGVADITVTFPKKFSSDPTVFVSLNGTLEGSSAGGISAIVRSANTTEFTVRIASTTTTYDGITVSWIAI